MIQWKKFNGSLDWDSNIKSKYKLVLLSRIQPDNTWTVAIWPIEYVSPDGICHNLQYTYWADQDEFDGTTPFNFPNL